MLIDDEEKIKKITEFLEKGGTLLAEHHDCGVPMIRFNGKTFCPVCATQEKAKHPDEKTVKGDFNQIYELLQRKILNIAISLENENELQRIKDKIECIEKGIKVLNLMKK